MRPYTRGLLTGILSSGLACGTLTAIAHNAESAFWSGAWAGALAVLWVWVGLNLVYGTWAAVKGG